AQSLPSAPTMTRPFAAIGAVCFWTLPHGVLVKSAAPVSPLNALSAGPTTNQTMALDAPSVVVDIGWCRSSLDGTGAHHWILGVAGVVDMSTTMPTRLSPVVPFGHFASRRASRATWTPEADMYAVGAA